MFVKVKNRATSWLALLISLSIISAVYLYLFPATYLPIVFATKYITFSTKPKMLVVWRYGLGERELGARIMRIAPKLGLKVKFVTAKFGKNRSIYDRYILDQPTLAAKAMQPDFVLIIDRAIPPIENFANYVVLDQSAEAYIESKDGKNVFINPDHYRFTGLFPTFKQIDLLKNTYEALGKPYRGFNWRPTVHATDYKAQEPKRLFFPGGALSDPTRSSEKYKQVYTMLAQAGYFEVYGWEEALKFLGASYKGYIPIDGETLLQKSNAAGISLVLHSAEHLNSGTPTGRIFEAVAANTVIISDKHAFIEEHFGNNVLYIDVDQNADQIYAQINQHMQWIYAHPLEARRMAENCHDVFLQKFTLESLLQDVVNLAMSQPSV